MPEKLLTNSLPSQIQLNFDLVIPKNIDCTTYWGTAEVLLAYDKEALFTSFNDRVGVIGV